MRIGKLLRKARNRIFKRPAEWQQIEFFDPRWKERIEAMSRYLAPGAGVLDLGCGERWLEPLLAPGTPYFPCDYTDRGPGTLVCDFNAKQFPDVRTDACFGSGIIEYVEDYTWFIDQMAQAAPRAVVSYCLFKPGDERALRRARAWKNHLTEAEFLAAFEKAGFSLEARGDKALSSQIFVFGRG